jgi:hypothetical protein
MLRKFFTRILITAVLLAIGGCATAPEMKPDGQVAITLDGVKKAGALSMRVANVLALTLPPARDGHVWEIAFHNTSVLKLMSPVQVGADGRSRVSFMALRGGGTRLKFLLVPAGSGTTATPVDQQDIQLSISAN